MEVPSQVICSYCDHAQIESFKFCTNCGKRNISFYKSELLEDKHHKVNLRLLSIYAIFSIVLLIIAAFTENTLEVLIVWTASFAAIDIVFATIQPSVWELLRVDQVRLIPLLSIILICLCSGFVVSFSMDYINMALFQETTQYIHLFEHLENSLLIAILIIAVFPAIFEELAFRGFVFSNLQVIGGKQSAIWGSTFLFALVHLSLLSFIWLIPFGLLLSYFRKKYSTIIYGIAGHFVHNATVTLIEYYEITL